MNKNLVCKTLAFIIVILFIGSSILPAISGLNIDANKSDNHNTEYNGYDDEGPLGEWPNFTPIGFITAT